MKTGLVIVTSCVLGAQAGAIVKRHDVPDARYRALAEDLECVAAVAGGSGTLIGPRWVLTAAHVTESLRPTQRTVRFGGETRTIDLIVEHPSWTGNLDDPESTLDIALVRLDRPVEGIRTFDLYRGADEIGMTITVAGVGAHGDGKRGPTGDDGARRAAHNRIESVESDRYLVFTFDAPPDALALEGISGPGDSGGPAFAEVDGERRLVGVSSGNDGEGEAHCTYGTREYYTRVSRAADWIESTMRGRADDRGDDLPEVFDLSGGDWPGTPAGGMIRAFTEAYNSSDEAAIRAFELKHRPDTDSQGRDADERVARWMELRDRFGPARPRAMAAGDDTVTLETDTDERRLTFTFELTESRPIRFSAVKIAAGGP